MNIVELPDTVMILVFEYLSYDEIAKKREVCQRFNQICQYMLNAGFNKAIREHGQNFKRIKALLPRRESERRNHCLSRHADILTSIETRISMLSMTYSKYIDLNLCCFIPGRVLDEIHRILRLIVTSTKQLRPHEVLQELRDISSMAIEHFDEKIAVDFKMEHLAKLAEQSRVKSSLGEISFSGANNSAARWSAVISAAARSSSGKTANTRCCESMIQRVNKLLALGASSNRVRANTSGSGEQQTQTSEEDDETQQQLTLHAKRNDTNKMLHEVKQLKIKYEKGLLKMRRMEQTQLQQTRRLREAHTAIAELSTQVGELKKQLEDVCSNRKLPTNINEATLGTATVSNSSVDVKALITKPIVKRQAIDSTRTIADESGTLLPNKKLKV